MTEQERDLLERVMGSWDDQEAALEFRVSAIPYDLPVLLPSFPSQQVVGSMTRRVRAEGGTQRWEIHLNAVAPARQILDQLGQALTQEGWSATMGAEPDGKHLQLRKDDLSLSARTTERRGLTQLALRVTRQPPGSEQTFWPEQASA